MWCTDRHGNLTDDADRMLGGCDTFDADGVGDRDPMYDDAPNGTGPKCGGCGFVTDYGPTGYPEGRVWVGPGCRHCDPVDHENKPYRFGIELWECAAALALRQEVRNHARLGLCREIDLTTACRWVGFSVRRAKHSDIIWDRLCDECETCGEARTKYEAWARRAVTITYRG